MLFFTEEKIAKQLSEIQPTIYREIYPIPYFKFHEGPCSGAERPDFDDRHWADFRVGDAWGGYDVVAWFRANVPIATHLRDQKVALRFLVGPRDSGGLTAETLLYVNGTPLQAIDIWHDEAWLPPEYLQQDEISIALKAWSGMLNVPERCRFKLAQLVQIDEATERFYYLADVLHKTITTLEEHDWRRVRLLETINEAFRRIDFTRLRSEVYYRSISNAARFLEEQIAELRSAEPVKPTVVGVGHSHIDMIWLWRLCHTREKAARSFSTVLHLMRQYPEYRYIHSSPQLYKFLSQDYPDIFARVKERIASGEWEITGGMWVEADTNLPNGESLIRQILFGKRYMRAEFGVETHTVWLPDVFGYSWALPQIICKSGLRYFVTSKISWNQFNRFPYDTFYWRGIDGSEVLSHFITTPENNTRRYTYNGTLSPAEVKGIWDNYQQKIINDELLLTYGWGDGGGGPTRQMLEWARIMDNVPGLPRVKLDKVEPYLARLERRLAGKDVPLWDGELYLEYHRGTYTSQAYIKRANRKAEILYHDAEWLSAIADIITGQQDYPAESLHEGWELILLNQFHDALPGSSIHQVYEDCRQDYARIETIGRSAIDDAQTCLLRQIPTEQPALVVFNSLSWQRNGLIELPWSALLAGRTIADSDGKPSPVQIVDNSGQKCALIEASDVPALGYRAYPLIPTDTQSEAEPMIITPDHLENRYYQIKLNEQGQIISIFDKVHRREVIAPGAAANVFQAFEDKPMNFDAWDIDPYYQEKMQVIDHLIGIWVEEQGPLRGVLLLQWGFYDSVITQRIVLYRQSPRIDFCTEIDWHEHQVLLKVAFPVAVRSTRATYEIQFGSIERPTHWNTSWDYAKFESVGHKWVDLSEGNYGVSLLNDCKYGHDIHDNVIRLTLLKSAIAPDEQADQGQHVFTYSLLPHAGDWRQGSTIHEAYALNYPLHIDVIPAAQPGSRAPTQYQFAMLDSDHVILETVKKAEDEDAWIVRVYESKQYRSSSVRLTFAQPIRKAVECNLVEEQEQPVRYEGSEIIFPIIPYEIKTFKVWF